MKRTNTLLPSRKHHNNNWMNQWVTSKFEIRLNTHTLPIVQRFANGSVRCWHPKTACITVQNKTSADVAATVCVQLAQCIECLFKFDSFTRLSVVIVPCFDRAWSPWKRIERSTHTLAKAKRNGITRWPHCYSWVTWMLWWWTGARFHADFDRTLNVIATKRFISIVAVFLSVQNILTSLHTRRQIFDYWLWRYFSIKSLK